MNVCVCARASVNIYDIWKWHECIQIDEVNIKNIVMTYDIITLFRELEYLELISSSSFHGLSIRAYSSNVYIFCFSFWTVT